MSKITPIIMPKWGLTMEEGTVGAWLVEVGTQIEVGMPILDVETEKLTNAVEATDAGLLPPPICPSRRNPAGEIAAGHYGRRGRERCRNRAIYRQLGAALCR